jgi:RNA polymerase sigma factor (sigma-70 family)
MHPSRRSEPALIGAESRGGQRGRATGSDAQISRQNRASQTAQRSDTDAYAHDETEAFDEVYRSLRGFIYARCRRLLSCDELAEDATQEISLKLLAHWSALPPGEPTRRWLHRVTTNYCLNQLRNEKRRHGAPFMLDEGTAPPPDGIANRQLVTRVLASLPPELRLVGWLSHVDECHQHDIAEELRISRRTVVSRLGMFRLRAKRILKSL